MKLTTRLQQEMKEMSALATRDTTVENREFWRNEMGKALTEIRQIYDDKLEAIRGEMNAYYNAKVRSSRRPCSSTIVVAATAASVQYWRQLRHFTDTLTAVMLLT